MTTLRRRSFILAAATAGTLAVTGGRAGAAVPYPFRLGIASGDPAADSVVLWTRLAPAPLNADGQGGMANADVTVDWQVAKDERFGSIVASGTVTARYADAHTVHVIAGGLAADSEYWYRFRAQGHLSAAGRTRTAPAAGTFGRDLRTAFASCAHWESGYFTAYRRMAEDRPDLILHLGDYLYEGGVTSGAVREHAGGEAITLADYRRRYAQYKSDPDLQAAHAVAPWLVVPDDHEVENNYAGTVRWGNSPALTAAQWSTRRAAALRAYRENMPLRPASTFHRRVGWGRLATFHLLDTRGFRDPQACGGGWKTCADADLSARTMTGSAQESWLLDGLAQRAATWDVLAQQILFAAQLDVYGAGNMDAWDGYRAARARIQQGWRDRGVRNAVVLTGDIHSAYANDLKADYRDERSAVIGTELVCTSIASDGDGSDNDVIPHAAVNPHLRWHSERRGYTLTTYGRSEALVDFREVPYVTEHGAAVTTARSFAVVDGEPGLQELT